MPDTAFPGGFWLRIVVSSSLSRPFVETTPSDIRARTAQKLASVEGLHDARTRYARVLLSKLWKKLRPRHTGLILVNEGHRGGGESSAFGLLSVEMPEILL